jgi:predicted amidohydrolase YtcJ
MEGLQECDRRGSLTIVALQTAFLLSRAREQGVFSVLYNLSVCLIRGFMALAALLAVAGLAPAQRATTVLLNGKILTVDPTFSTAEALAVRDGRIVAVGTSADLRKMAGKQARIIDLAGRTVIPGLIDSHMHAIRAALSFSTEVNWIGTRSLAEAMDRIRQASHTMAPGAWLIVAGGWSVQQFAENRRPTQAELVAAAPESPVYVQLGYGWAMLTPKALDKLHIASDADLPAGGKLERDSDGKLTGGISGAQNAIIALFDRLPTPTPQLEVDGTKKFFRELNRLGLTGVVDPGGNNMTPESYQALFKVWRQHELTVRVAYSLCGITPGKEFEELKDLTQMLPMGFGDGMLRFNGIGERITWGMNNNNKPTVAEREKYYEIVRWAAERGMSLTMHWPRNDSVGVLLDIFERVNKDVPISNLRWSIAHLNDASPENLRRMKALGVGWTVQDAMYFQGDQFLKQEGAQAARRVPPVETAKEIGVVVGAGTDAHRVASYNPFTALQWFLDGKTVSGVAIRGPEETPSRAEALRLYTMGSAWFSHDEDERGSIEPGKLADLAVLSKDYITVPVEQVGGIESLLTMVGGKIVYAAGPYTQFEDQH